ncbi:acyl-CoA dehydrogenase family protein [Pseudomonas sp. NPDC007930]|uniref:acyl-CoA dehydrogenase family protein n=1 Tax=Pseudomonas sp. NPDC007930 TaxID=3364417 RepID=UPI0036EE3693
MPHSTELQALYARLAATAAARERRREQPYQEVAELAALGFGALRVPTALGGGGLSVAQLTEQLLQLASADANFVQVFRAHFIFVESLLLAEPSSNRDLWLRRIAAGAVVGGAHTERNPVNTDHFATQLHSEGGERWLSGEKYYATGSLFADWVATLAEDEDQRLTLLVVPRDAEGLSLPDDWDGFGQRLTASGSARFERVKVGAENALPIFESLAPYATSLAQHFHLIALAGIARNAHADAVDYVRARTRYFSHGSGQLPRDDAQVQALVGELSSAAYSSAVIVRDIGERLDTMVAWLAQPGANADALNGLEHDVFRAQHLLVQRVLEAATRLFDVGGASALAESRNWDRHWRNARTLASHNPVDFRLRAIGNYELTGEVALRAWFSGVDLRQRAF